MKTEIKLPVILPDTTAFSSVPQGRIAARGTDGREANRGRLFHDGGIASG